MGESQPYDTPALIEYWYHMGVAFIEFIVLIPLFIRTIRYFYAPQVVKDIYLTMTLLFLNFTLVSRIVTGVLIAF